MASPPTIPVPPPPKLQTHMHTVSSWSPSLDTPQTAHAEPRVIPQTHPPRSPFSSPGQTSAPHPSPPVPISPLPLCSVPLIIATSLSTALSSSQPFHGSRHLRERAPGFGLAAPRAGPLQCSAAPSYPPLCTKNSHSMNTAPGLGPTRWEHPPFPRPPPFSLKYSSFDVSIKHHRFQEALPAALCSEGPAFGGCSAAATWELLVCTGPLVCKLRSRTPH